MKTYDLVFSDENNENSKGWKESIEYCKEYIRENNETGETVYTEEVK